MRPLPIAPVSRFLARAGAPTAPAYRSFWAGLGRNRGDGAKKAGEDAKDGEQTSEFYKPVRVVRIATGKHGPGLYFLGMAC